MKSLLAVMQNNDVVAVPVVATKPEASSHEVINGAKNNVPEVLTEVVADRQART